MSFARARGLDDVLNVPIGEGIGDRCTQARDAAGELRLSTLRPGWWRDAAEGPRAWVRATRAWSTRDPR